MPDIDPCEELRKDAEAYAARIRAEIAKFPPRLVPVVKEVGDAYMRSYRKKNGIPFAVQISKEALAYLYKYVVENGAAGAAIGFGHYDKNELPKIPTGWPYPTFDPNWNEAKSNTNTAILGVWDNNKGILPLREGGEEIYDDWNQEWP